MKITIKGCVYRVETLTPELKEKFSSEIQKALEKEKQLKELEDTETEQKKVSKKYKKLEED